MGIEHFKTDFYCWFDETWSPFNLSEQILKGISIKILPISEEIDLHKFCYPEELYPYYGLDIDGIVKTALEFLK